MPGNSYQANYSSSDKSGFGANSVLGSGNNYGLGAGAKYPDFPFAAVKGGATTSQTAAGSAMYNFLPIVAGIVGVVLVLSVLKRKG